MVLLRLFSMAKARSKETEVVDEQDPQRAQRALFDEQVSAANRVMQTIATPGWADILKLFAHETALLQEELMSCPIENVVGIRAAIEAYQKTIAEVNAIIETGKAAAESLAHQSDSY